MIKFLHGRRRKAGESSSHVVSTLERIRDMREHSQWEPLTPPSTIRERTVRIAEAREHINVPPLGNERETREPVIQDLSMAELRRPILYSMLALAALLAAVTTFHRERDVKSQIRQASFVYPGVAYTNLTEAAAERFARRALASTGLDEREWHTLKRSGTNDTTLLTFLHEDEPPTTVRVKVELEPGERILCTIEPR